jgi:hypothetical protein
MASSSRDRKRRRIEDDDPATSPEKPPALELGAERTGDVDEQELQAVKESFHDEYYDSELLLFLKQQLAERADCSSRRAASARVPPKLRALT